jgi:hypothetical protein
MTRITKGRPLFAPSGSDRSGPSHTSRRTVERWAGVAVVIVTGAVLAVTTLTADDEAQPVGHPLIAEHTNNEGSVRDSAGSSATRRTVACGPQRSTCRSFPRKTSEAHRRRTPS